MRFTFGTKAVFFFFLSFSSSLLNDYALSQYFLFNMFTNPLPSFKDLDKLNGVTCIKWNRNVYINPVLHGGILKLYQHYDFYYTPHKLILIMIQYSQFKFPPIKMGHVLLQNKCLNHLTTFQYYSRLSNSICEYDI